MRLIVFFTWDVSLALWKTKGLLQREMKLYQALARQGVDVVLLTWGHENDAQIALSFPELTIVPIFTRLKRFPNKFLRALSSLIAPFIVSDLIITKTVFKTNQMFGAWVAVLAKYLYRKPLLVRTGYEYYDFTLRGGYGLLRKTFAWLISFLAYKSADHIFLASRSDGKFVQDHFSIASEKITICPNWIDTDLFSPIDDPQQDGILYVGRLNAQKNLPALIEAVAKTEYSLEIVGIGELEQSLKTLAEKCQGRIHFSGTVPNDLLPEKYRNCSLYILPSFYEGNPKTLLEAMSCGAAVLGADAPGIREVIQHEQNGFLAKGDAGSLYDAIIRLMRDPVKRKSLGNKARETILANNTLDAQVRRELDCLRRLTISKDESS